MGSVCVVKGNAIQAQLQPQRAMAIFKMVFEDEPALLEEKCKEIGQAALVSRQPMNSRESKGRFWIWFLKIAVWACRTWRIESSARTRRLIREGVILESVFPQTQHMDLEALKVILEKCLGLETTVSEGISNGTLTHYFVGAHEAPGGGACDGEPGYLDQKRRKRPETCVQSPKKGVREITSRVGRIKKKPMEMFQTNRASFEAFPSENRSFFPVQESRKVYEKQKDFIKTGLTKKQKTNDIYYRKMASERAKETRFRALTTCLSFGYVALFVAAFIPKRRQQ